MMALATFSAVDVRDVGGERRGSGLSSGIDFHWPLEVTNMGTHPCMTAATASTAMLRFIGS
jgi:hypothetical protein